VVLGNEYYEEKGGKTRIKIQGPVDCPHLILCKGTGGTLIGGERRHLTRKRRGGLYKKWENEKNGKGVRYLSGVFRSLRQRKQV